MSFESPALRRIADAFEYLAAHTQRLYLAVEKNNELREQHHAQDVALYERSIACSEEITRYAGRQTLVAECTLNARLNSRTTPTEG